MCGDLLNRGRHILPNRPGTGFKHPSEAGRERANRHPMNILMATTTTTSKHLRALLRTTPTPPTMLRQLIRAAGTIDQWGGNGKADTGARGTGTGSKH